MNAQPSTYEFFATESQMIGLFELFNRQSDIARGKYLSGFMDYKGKEIEARIQNYTFRNSRQEFKTLESADLNGDLRRCVISFDNCHSYETSRILELLRIPGFVLEEIK